MSRFGKTKIICYIECKIVEHISISRKISFTLRRGRFMLNLREAFHPCQVTKQALYVVYGYHYLSFHSISL